MDARLSAPAAASQPPRIARFVVDRALVEVRHVCEIRCPLSSYGWRSSAGDRGWPVLLTTCFQNMLFMVMLFLPS
jgi:hypothetical protein